MCSKIYLTVMRVSTERKHHLQRKNASLMGEAVAPGRYFLAFGRSRMALEVCVEESLVLIEEEASLVVTRP